MPVILTDNDYHEINTRYELLRKGAAAFLGADFVLLASAVTLYIAAGGWGNIRPGSSLWQVFYVGFVFIGLVTLLLVPIINRLFGGINLACPEACKVGPASRRLSIFVLLLTAAGMAPVFCGFLLFFFTGSKISALLIGLCGTAAKTFSFPKRKDIEKIVRKSKEDAGDVPVIEPGSGQYLITTSGRHTTMSGRHMDVPRPAMGDGDVEVPARIQKRLEKSRKKLSTLWKMGKLGIGFERKASERKPKQGDKGKKNYEL